MHYVYYEISLHHQFYLFRGLVPMLKAGDFHYKNSSFLQFCHALGLKIALNLLLT